MPQKRILLGSAFLVLATYMTFGSFFLELPRVDHDDIWELSRGIHFAKSGLTDDPLLPEEVAPFLASLKQATPFSQLSGLINTSTGALGAMLLPDNELYGFRLMMFFWSALLCIMTFAFARRIGLGVSAGIMSIAWLVAAPEFFSQIHSSRTEIMLTACYLGGILLILRATSANNSAAPFLLFIVALYAWMPALLVHPSGIYIPAALFLIYLLRLRENWISLRTFYFGLSLLPGLVFFLYIMLAPSFHAATQQAGDYLNAQGPPILNRDFWHFVKTPLHLYQRFAEVNFLSQPVSLSWILLATMAFIQMRQKRADLIMRNRALLMVACAVPMIVLILFSGSYGPYNISVFPFFAIVLGHWSYLITEKQRIKALSASLFLSFALILTLASNFLEIERHIKYAEAFRQMQAEVRATIPSKKRILGTALYYLSFKNQPYFMNFWFYPAAGRPDQSFEAGCRALEVDYIIVDDHFWGTAVKGRDAQWVAEMERFLGEKCEIQRSLYTSFYNGKRGPAIEKYPAAWRYPEMKQNYIQRIQIYRVKDDAWADIRADQSSKESK